MKKQFFKFHFCQKGLIRGKRVKKLAKNYHFVKFWYFEPIFVPINMSIHDTLIMDTNHRETLFLKLSIIVVCFGQVVLSNILNHIARQSHFRSFHYRKYTKK